MKAHSARVTSKNFRMIAGKPLFRWVLDALAETPEIDRIVINTDARSILADNDLKDGDCGGKVMIRDRKPEICGDFVSMNLVLGDDIANVPSDYYLMTHTTNPLLSVKTIRTMIKLFDEATTKGEADSLFTVTRRQTRFYTPEGAPINHDPANLIRCSDLRCEIGLRPTTRFRSRGWKTVSRPSTRELCLPRMRSHFSRREPSSIRSASSQ